MGDQLETFFQELVVELNSTLKPQITKFNLDWTNLKRSKIYKISNGEVTAEFDTIGSNLIMRLSTSRREIRVGEFSEANKAPLKLTIITKIIEAMN